MTQSEKMDYPGMGIAYSIIDDFGHRAELNPQEAFDLFEWLYQQRDELEQLTHPPLQALPE